MGLEIVTPCDKKAVFSPFQPFFIFSGFQRFFPMLFKRIVTQKTEGPLFLAVSRKIEGYDRFREIGGFF